MAEMTCAAQGLQEGEAEKEGGGEAGQHGPLRVESGGIWKSRAELYHNHQYMHFEC